MAGLEALWELTGEGKEKERRGRGRGLGGAARGGAHGGGGCEGRRHGAAASVSWLLFSDGSVRGFSGNVREKGNRERKEKERRKKERRKRRKRKK
jgi:hypothetical protein